MISPRSTESSTAEKFLDASDAVTSRMPSEYHNLNFRFHYGSVRHPHATQRTHAPPNPTRMRSDIGLGCCIYSTNTGQCR
jgi:hypothetical protein